MLKRERRLFWKKGVLYFAGNDGGTGQPAWWMTVRTTPDDSMINIEIKPVLSAVSAKP
jgi:hypothetical protein